MHNGRFATLGDVVAFYDIGGGVHENKSPALKPLGLTDAEQKALVAFLRSLSGDLPVIERPALPEYDTRAPGKN